MQVLTVCPDLTQQGTTHVTIACENGDNTPARCRTQMLAAVTMEVVGHCRKCMGKDAAMVVICGIWSRP